MAKETKEQKRIKWIMQIESALEVMRNNAPLTPKWNRGERDFQRAYDSDSAWKLIGNEGMNKYWQRYLGTNDHHVGTGRELNTQGGKYRFRRLRSDADDFVKAPVKSHIAI
jgi:hypothetical protein